MKNTLILTIALMFVFGLILNSKQTNAQESKAKDYGVGPFKDVKLGPVDNEKAKKGAALFKNKCVACHDLDKKLVGPPLRNVTKEQTPEFILNNIVNPTGMQKSNAQIKAMLKKYNNVPMTDQKITQPEALNLLDYLRSSAK